jgi:hypothetical protein
VTRDTSPRAEDFSSGEACFRHFPAMDEAPEFMFAAPAADDPRRSERRMRTLLTGKLVFGEHGLTADCTIRNLSSGGAKLQTSLAATLPREVWLIVVRKDCAYRASVAWRVGEEVGVRFEHEYDLARDMSPDLAIVRRVWREMTNR